MQTMRKDGRARVWIGGVLALAGLIGCRPSSAPSAVSPTDSAALTPSAPAIRGGGLFADDLGPETLDVSAYPKAHQEGYRLLAERCGKCHKAARALNAPFVDLTREEMAAVKTSQPEVFGQPAVWRIEPDIWEHYTRRMSMKPISVVTGKEAASIRAFLSYDSRKRKLGAAAPAWKVHREALLKEFRRMYPETATALYGPPGK